MLVEQEALSDVQLSEIQKIFSVCDRDGDGRISATELRTVMQTVLERPPSDTEISQLFAIMDIDQNGTIEFEEFSAALKSWFEDYAPPTMHTSLNPPSSRKRKHPEQERKEVHKKIRSFLEQFSKNEAFEKLRKQLGVQVHDMAVSPHFVVDCTSQQK